MDRDEAKIFHVDAATFDEATVHSPNHHVHRHPKDQETRTHNHPDDEHRFFQAVAAALSGADQVLVVGPSVTKLRFLRYAQKHDPALEPESSASRRPTPRIASWSRMFVSIFTTPSRGRAPRPSLGVAMFGWLKRRRREAARRGAFPAAWRAIIEKNVPYAAGLSLEDRQELLGHVQVFLAEKRFEGCGGLSITDEVRVTIAAQACVLLLHRQTDYYPRLVSILVYPSTYLVPGGRRSAERPLR